MCFEQEQPEHKLRSKNTNPKIKIQKLKISISPFSQTKSSNPKAPKYQINSKIQHSQSKQKNLKLRKTHLKQTHLRKTLTFPLSLTPRTINLSTKRHSFLHLQNDNVFKLEDELVIIDCVAFEECVFDDPYLQNDIEEEPQTPKPNKKTQ